MTIASLASLLGLLLLVLLAENSQQSSPKWDGLRVTWGPKLDDPAFFKRQPRTVEEAVKKGFKCISECDVNANWRGARYVKDDDRALTLLYDVNGYIAGIQFGIAKTFGTFPDPKLQPPFVDAGDYWAISTYFVDPLKICTTGRSASEFHNEGTGTDLYIQNTNVPEDSIIMPKQESKLKGTSWLKGGCIPNMGQHYWHDFRVDSDCDALFPVFLLYNQGKLSAFGWSVGVNHPSPHLEHPTPQVFPIFLPAVPKCLKQRVVSTMHIYLRDVVYEPPC